MGKIMCKSLFILIAAMVMVFLGYSNMFATGDFSYNWRAWYTPNGFDVAKTDARTVTGDFDGDGKEEIVAFYDYGGATTAIHRWTLNGNEFHYDWKVWEASGFDVTKIDGRIMVGDFTGDGKDEIAAFYDCGNGSTALHHWAWNGSTFDYSWQVWVGTGFDSTMITHRIVVGDFTGDRKDEIVAFYDYGNGNIELHHWAWNGNAFTPWGGNTFDYHWKVWDSTGFDITAIENRIIVGDFTGDGKDEIAAFYDYGNGNVAIHRWAWNGNAFTPWSGNTFEYNWKVWEAATGYDITMIDGRIIVGDFSGDGKDEIAAFYDYGNNSTAIHHWAWNGNAFTAWNGNTFSYYWRAWYVPSGFDVTKTDGRIIVGDFDGNGKDEIASFFDDGNNSSASLHHWSWNGTAFSYYWRAWHTANGFDLSKTDGRIMVGDFDGSGDSEISAFYDNGNSSTAIHVWSDSSHSGQGSGQLNVWPVPSGRTLSSEYKAYNPGRPNHNGVDISFGGIAGKAVVASGGGIVRTSYNCGHTGTGGTSYGNYVVIDHGNGITSYYAHLYYPSSLRAGDRVNAGDYVGAVGSTGNSSGYHLHFEVQHNGIAVDPLGYYGLGLR